MTFLPPSSLVPLFESPTVPRAVIQGRLTAWNPTTRENTVQVLGQNRTDLPVLEPSEGTLTAPCTVFLIPLGNTYVIAGRMYVPVTESGGGGDSARIYRSGSSLYRGEDEWWFLGYNSFVWSANCGNPGEQMSTAQVESWFDSMRQDGHGLVRLFFFRNWNLARLDHAVAAAKARNIYLLITVDDAIAGCGEDHKDEAWFANPVMRADYQAHFEALLTRYAGETTIAAFEYFNEPGAGHNGNPGASAATIRSFYDSMGTVRDAIDPTRLMSTGTIAPYIFGSGSTGLNGYRLVNESPGVDIASVHEYDQGEVISNHVAGSIANSDGKPLLIGEFGINANETGASCFASFSSRATAFAAKTQAYVDLTGCCGALAWAWQPGSATGTCGFGTLDKDSASQGHLRTKMSTTKV